jgi:hypothetical protein
MTELQGNSKPDLDLEFPLTCRWCSNSPATHLIVFDPRSPVARQVVQVCGPCGHRAVTDSAHITRSPASVWLYLLMPDTSPEHAATGEPA